MKKILSIILVLMLMLPLLPQGIISFESNAAKFIEIYTVEDLYNVRNDRTANYRLMNDIDLTEATAKGGDWDFMGNGWNPIGSNDVYGNSAFSGEFDGNNHKIIGMRIEVTSLPSGVVDKPCYGLFASIKGYVHDLEFSGGSITVKKTPSFHTTYAGALAGIVIDTTISNIKNNMSAINVTASTMGDIRCGGITGYVTYSNIVSCANSAEINVCIQGGYGDANYGYVGGIVGDASGTAISESYNTGKCNGTYKKEASYYTTDLYVAGICGRSIPTTTIEDCYNTSEIKGTYTLTNGISHGGVVTKCYNIGAVSVIDVAASGYGIGGSTVSNSYYLNSMSNTSGATALTEYQMKLQAMYAGFDFENVWIMDPNAVYPYPQLRDNIQDMSEATTLVSILAWPTKTEYMTGDKIDLSGSLMKVVYASGREEIIPIQDEMISGFDMNVEGEQTVTVTVGGLNDSFVINVIERPEVESVVIISQPDKKEFVVGTSFDFSGAKAQVTYDGGIVEVVELTPEITMGGNINRIGKQTITYTAGEKKASFEVTVIGVSLEKISVTSLPTRLSYYVGQELDLTGLIITATMNNGIETVVTDSCTVTGFSSTAGKHTLTVTYLDKTAYFDVTVIERSIISVSVTQKPSKLNYLEGEEFNKAGMVVTVYYDDGMSEVVTDYSISGYDPTPGTKVITITYSGVKTVFTVTVAEKSIISLAVTKKPTKLTYLEGSRFDDSGMVITAYYDNGTFEEVSGYVVSGFTPTPGTKMITVYYGGLSANFSVDVIAKSVVALSVTQKPYKTTYFEGEPFDATGMVVTATYDNGTSQAVTDYSVSGYSSTVGTKVVVISFGGFEDAFNVEVVTRTLSYIAITQKPAKLNYIEGEAFEKAGMVVTGYYNDGGSVELKDYVVSGYDPAPGTKTITISYGGFKVTFTVEVSTRSVTSLVVKNMPNKTLYFEGEAFDPTGLIITAVYNDGVTFDISDYIISGYSATAGIKTIEVIYNDVKTSFNVEVISKDVVSVIITNKPNKLTYFDDEEFDPTGLQVLATYNDGSVVEVTDYLTSGYDKTPGTKTIIVSHGGKTATFEVTVVAKVVIMKGDFDKDESITVSDALAALRIAAKLAASTEELMAIGDIDADGKITVSDSLAILRVAAKMSDAL